ncbi:hypothetical protein [Paenibacillus tyrfis]|nr:hypothetical protein [Paenibacillus tyrfis]
MPLALKKFIAENAALVLSSSMVVLLIVTMKSWFGNIEIPAEE